MDFNRGLIVKGQSLYAMRLRFCIPKEGIHARQLGALNRSAVAVSLVAIFLSPMSARAENLIVDNRREVISEQEAYETIRVGGQDNNSYLDIVEGGNVHASDAVVIGDYRPVDPKDSFYGVGTITVSGDSARLTSDGKAVVGGASTGTMVVSKGGTVSAEQFVIGADATGIGTLVFGAVSGEAATGAGSLEGTDGAPAEIVFGEGEGTIVLNHTHESYEFDATVSGNGDLVHEAGTTRLTGDMSGFSGVGYVSGGTLYIDTDFGGSAVVEDGGTLTGSGTVADLTFEAGAIYYVNPNTGTLESTGAVTLGEGTTLEVVYYDVSTTDILAPTVVLSGETVTGEFETFEGEEDYLFVDLNVGYLPDAVTVVAVRNDTGFDELARTTNQMATAGAMDTLAQGNLLYDSIATLDNSETGNIPAYLDQLSGEVHASIQGVTLTAAGRVRDIVKRRAAVHLNSVNKPDLIDASEHTAVLAITPGWGSWTQGYGTLERVEGDGNATSLEKLSVGVLTGVEGSTPDGILAGIMGGYEQGATSVDGIRSDADLESFQLGTYFGKTFGPVQMIVGSVLASNEIDTTREVDFPGYSDVLSANYRSSTLQLFGETGYTVQMGIAQFEPFTGLALTYLDTDAFEETGGDAALQMNASSQALGVTTLGLRARHHFAGPWQGTEIRLEGGIAWHHSFGSITPGVTSSFAGSDLFDIEGVPLDENTLLLQAAASFGLTNRLAVAATYYGEFGARASANSFQAGVSLKF